MTNPEMGSREPEDKNQQEKEQSAPEILTIISEAIEKGREVLLTQNKSDGESITNAGLPLAIEGGCLVLEADGYGFSIEISSVKRVELIENEVQEMSPEDLQEMLNQLPALQVMLSERKEKIKRSGNKDEIEKLEEEINEIKIQIAFREEIQREIREWIQNN